MLQYLARGAGVRESLRDELERFYDAIQQAVDTGNPEWLDPLLNSWADAQTESEPGVIMSGTSAFLAELLLESQRFWTETFQEQESLEIVGALLPLFTHAFEQTAKRELTTRMTGMQRELENIRTTLAQVEKSKADFISVAAHELRTPLTLIEGYAAMIRDAFEEPGSGGTTTPLVDGIDNGTRRLREIIDDMIDVSLLENGLMALNYQPLWLNGLFRTLAAELSQSVQVRNQRLDFSEFSGSQELTFGDPERLFQAFRNLLTNAIKFTPDGGRILIDGRLLPGFIEVTIKDTGIGIDPEDQMRIFQKFAQVGDVQLHSSGKIKYKGGGPGLGLPITKGLIEAHGGSIWVESEFYDEVRCPGSTFHVLLPHRREPPDPVAQKSFQSMIEQRQSA